MWVLNPEELTIWGSIAYLVTAIVAPALERSCDSASLGICETYKVCKVAGGALVQSEGVIIYLEVFLKKTLTGVDLQVSMI